MLKIKYYKNDKQLGQDLLELGIKSSEILKKQITHPPDTAGQEDDSEINYLENAREIKEKLERTRSRKVKLKINKMLGKRRLISREIFLLGYVTSKIFFNGSSAAVQGKEFLKKIHDYRKGDVGELYKYWDIINGKTALLKSKILISSYISSDKIIMNKDIQKALIGVREQAKEKKVRCGYSSPLEIKKELDKYIIGQERPKRVIAHAAYTYIRDNAAGDHNFPNILMMGPTGSGKTHLVKTLGRILNFPFVSIDATQLTREGYVGGSVMELLLEMKTAQRRLNKKEDRGILYIDEIDKTAARSGSSSDINGRPVQEELLKVLGNERVKGMANVRGTFGREKVDIDTSKMLVICGGSFQEFESNKEPIGFYDTGNGKPERESWTNSDLLEMGFIPELLGRLPIRVFLEELSTEQLVGIIKNPRVTPFKNFQCLLPEGMTAEDIPKEDLISIARQTAKLGVGARGMLSVMEEYLAPRIYGQVDTEKKEKYL